jgi:CelD/BcsL family acetyltransferase involved in cellulose biosynthesis
MTRLLIERVESLAALERDWRALEPSLPALPFVGFDWASAWWTHLSERKLGVRDELFLLALRTEQGELRAVAPMMRTCRPGVGPLCVRELQFFGADPNITELRGLAAPEASFAAALTCLLDYLRSCSGEWDWMKFTGLPAAAGLDSQLLSFPKARFTRDVPNFTLALAPTWAEFKTRLSRNIKESLRKCYNAPKRDGLTFEISVKRDAADVKAAVGEFLRLHQTRSELEGTIQHGNVFESASAQQFLLEVCERFAARDALRVFQLKRGSDVIATRIGFVCGEVLYLYYSGFDPEFGRYSVMTTTVAEAIQYAIAEGFRTVNLSTGSDVSKLRWGPDETVYRDAFLVSPSRRGELADVTYSFARRGIDRALSRTNLQRLFSRRAG